MLLWKGIESYSSLFVIVLEICPFAPFNLFLVNENFIFRPLILLWRNSLKLTTCLLERHVFNNDLVSPLLVLSLLFIPVLLILFEPPVLLNLVKGSAPVIFSVWVPKKSQKWNWVLLLRFSQHISIHRKIVWVVFPNAFRQGRQVISVIFIMDLLFDVCLFLHPHWIPDKPSWISVSGVKFGSL